MPPVETPAEEHGKQFEAGEVLFREGEPGRHLYVIQHGAVRVTKQLAGRDVIMADLGDGEFVGEIGVVCNVHTLTAVALEATQCLLVDAVALEEMVANDGEIGVRLVRALAQRLAACHLQLDLIGRPPAARVALAIARHCENEGQPEPEGLFVPRRLRDLGGELAVGEEELGLVSKVLIRERLIRIKRNGILVPDLHRMYDFVRAADEAGETRSDDA